MRECPECQRMFSDNIKECPECAHFTLQVVMRDAPDSIVHHTVRTFDTGATRSPAEGKPEYAGYMSPLVVEAFGAYMLKNQVQSDGNIRDSRNWQKGIPLESYMQSMMRHFVEVWKLYEANKDSVINDSTFPDLLESLMALKFNVDGMAHEVLNDNPK